MRIFDNTFKNELHLSDEELKLGILYDAEIMHKHNGEREEDGKIVEFEYETSEPIKVFYPYNDYELKAKGLYQYSNEELKEIEYQDKLLPLQDEYNYYQQKIAETDHKLFKYVEGYYTDEEYEPIKQERESYRVKIRELENKIQKLNEEYGK